MGDGRGRGEGVVIAFYEGLGACGRELAFSGLRFGGRRGEDEEESGRMESWG